MVELEFQRRIFRNPFRWYSKNQCKHRKSNCFGKRVREVLAENPDVYDPRKYLGPARDAIKETVTGKIREFGSSDKA